MRAVQELAGLVMLVVVAGLLGLYSQGFIG